MTCFTLALQGTTALALLVPGSDLSAVQIVSSAPASRQSPVTRHMTQGAIDPSHILPAAAHSARRPPRMPAPVERVGAANHAARIEPDQASFANAIQRYPFVEGSLYQVYTKPGQVTDIALQKGEKLVGPGPVAAGDTARWLIGNTISGTGAGQQVHILVKPTRSDIATNLVINTDRRTYHIELRSNAQTYMASVSWSYPQDDLIALRQAALEEARAAPLASGLDISRLDFGYTISGDKPDWRPVRAFDDGIRVYVEFPQTAAQRELPPLFAVGPGGRAEIVNYRVSGRYMIVDRLFQSAELRLGDGRRQLKVRIMASRRKAS
ncbi:P-type conjugative transfer protein TrbG [Blastomonas sp.]|uniref:P-type conjugative transfer protein TrbG n=1 Tax=Blastomonas sp. TaxID=1909299 RepID=UPI00406AAF53